MCINRRGIYHIMLKTNYQSIFRCHTFSECVTSQIKENSDTDLLLYIVDVYDVLLSVESGALPPPMEHEINELRELLSDYLLKHWIYLYKPIPGRLIGWTHSMLLYINILMLIRLQYKGKTVSLSADVMKYTKQYRLRLFEDPDPENWTLVDLVSMLDVVSFRWNKLEAREELTELLEILWIVSARLITQMHTKDKLNIDNYCEVVSENHVRVGEVGIVASMSRFFYFNQCLNQVNRWRTIIFDEVPENTNWDTFLVAETKHFVTRRFRDSIIKFIWDKIINHGDVEIASHDQLGDTVSAFTCIFQRFPAGMITLLQKCLTYDEPEEILANDTLRPYVHIMMVAQHFIGVYNVNFILYFVVFERSQYKHMAAIERSTIPIILSRMGQFCVYYKREVYVNSKGGDFKHAFLLWLHMLRKFCKCKAFDSMDFTELVETLLDHREVLNNSRSIPGFYDLTDE
jgi:hypothetical protein